MELSKVDIIERIKEEVSRVAARAYAQQEGTAPVFLYDTVIITSQDDATIDRMYQDAMHDLLIANRDIAVSEDEYKTDATGQYISEPGISFNLPDMDERVIDEVIREMSNYFAMHVCASWLVQRYAPAVEEYAARRDTSLNRLNALLRMRKKPSRTWK